jgi:hypothetical protein
MPNGEVRLRLVSDDGSAYIKTLRPSAGAWQNSHSHKSLVETYVVQSGWMALAALTNDGLKITVHTPGALVSTEPNVAHNVYLAADSVIHTIKHGGAADWTPHPELNALTTALTEPELLARAAFSAAAKPLGVSVDQRYASYVEIYDNMDNLIWLVPGFVLTAGLSALGLVVELASRTPRESAHMLGWLVLALVIFFFMGGYSVMRIRHHHTMMGRQLRALEVTGYFSEREKSLNARYLPSAPHLFMTLFYVLAAVLLVASLALFASWGGFLDLFTAAAPGAAT